MTVGVARRRGRPRERAVSLPHGGHSGDEDVPRNSASWPGAARRGLFIVDDRLADGRRVKCGSALAISPRPVLGPQADGVVVAG